MKLSRLKALAELQTDRRLTKPVPSLVLDQVESGTGRLLGDVQPQLPPDVGVADALPGDVLFGKLRPYLAKVVRVQAASVASTELMCLRPKTGVDSSWLFYLLLSRMTIEWAVASSEGTKMPRTSWERLGQLAVSVPPLAEQRAIADYLEAEDSFVGQQLGVRRGVPARLPGGRLARVGHTS